MPITRLAMALAVPALLMACEPTVSNPGITDVRGSTQPVKIPKERVVFKDVSTFLVASTQCPVPIGNQDKTFLALLAPIAVAAIEQLAGLVLNQVSEELEEYLEDFTLSVNLSSSHTLNVGTPQCIAFRRPEPLEPESDPRPSHKHPYLVLQTRYVPEGAKATPVAMQIRPLWFDPRHFPPHKRPKRGNTAVSVTVTPVYFREGELLVQPDVGLLTAQLTKTQTTQPFEIRGEDNGALGLPWSSYPIIALPTDNDFVDFRVDIGVAGDPPFLPEQLAQLLGSTRNDIAGALGDAVRDLVEDD